ncbi:MAG: tetratricopeptide repeat protein [Kiritimatiellia bacterium]|nr:tetratricopeptide repeat protein [Kiritimatiellia bacterium]
MKLIPTLFFSLVLLLGLSASVNAQRMEWKALYEEANSLYDKGQYDRAAVVAKKAISVAETTFGPDNVYVAASLATLGGIYCMQGQYEVAEALYRSSLSIYEKASGPTNACVVSIRKAIEVIHTKNSNQATESKVSLPTDSATTQQIVECFTSDGVKMVQYDMGAMKKIDRFNKKEKRLAVHTQSGIQEYGTFKRVDSSTIKKLSSFMMIRKNLSGYAPDKYVSCEFLVMLKSPEEIKQDAANAGPVYCVDPIRTLENQENAAKIRNIESQQQQLQGEIFMMNQYRSPALNPR